MNLRNPGKWLLTITAIFTFTIMTGCNSYVTPAKSANMSLFAGTSNSNNSSESPGVATTRTIADLLKRKPVAKLPLNIVMARVQDTDFRPYRYTCTRSYGSGKYSVVTVRDIEEDDDIIRLNKLNYIQQISPLNKLLLPPVLESDMELRNAAAQMHAEMILIYTFQTDSKSEDTATPLSIVTLGLSPTVNVFLTTTVSALLMDTQTGYIYGSVEASSSRKQKAAWMTNSDAIDQSRRFTERDAFEKLLTTFENTWPAIASKCMSR